MSTLAILVVAVGVLETLTFAACIVLYVRARSVFRSTFPMLVKPRKTMGEPPPAPAGSSPASPAEGRSRPRKRGRRR